MRNIKICDMTMAQFGKALSFREKIELCKQLDNLGVSVICLEGLGESRTDALRIKSIAAAVKNATVAVPVRFTNIQDVWNALQEAKAPRLQVCAPLSSVQMEYLYHKKADAMATAIAEAVAACKALCSDVEFVAEDATRADKVFLQEVVTAAAQAGATTVTLCDTAGAMLPEEFSAFLQSVTLPEGVNLGIWCGNQLSMADACAVAAVAGGANEVKAAAYGADTCSLETLAKVIHARQDALNATCTVQAAQLSRSLSQIAWMCQGEKKTAYRPAQQDEGIYLTVHDSRESVLKAVEQLGYDLSAEDADKVCEAFFAIAGKKDQVGIRELDAIVATAAMQVPSAYKLDTYVINAGNAISSSAHMRLVRDGATLEGVCLGDGPIDAAFMAIESITGHHYELDDFQIQAVTEGREAMGQTIVRLRSQGKLYSGRGISTDIVCASIHAYLNALNKIVYEEEEA